MDDPPQIEYETVIARGDFAEPVDEPNIHDAP
jgi:hypothetical protein